MPDTSGLHVCHHSYDSQCQFLMPGMGCCRNHDLVKIHYDHSKTPRPREDTPRPREDTPRPREPPGKVWIALA
ncbi:hypothetical protein DPMN_024058 [Dreissena polymorpha]|uniref:Uncharacterized protein n=1 Tax=Dreissena polymorpha TaxID=45954 RepID=A0A9D4LN73_DREPO|nr:hypothetical protein DPMN_024058 [Dreissena polymorpha]